MQLLGTTDGFNETACHVTDLKHLCNPQDGLKRKGSRFVATGILETRLMRVKGAKCSKTHEQENGHLKATKANSLSLLSGAIDL